MNLENTGNHTHLFQMHVMWYESEMIPETLDSIMKAIDFAKPNVKFLFCLNSQTYMEKPTIGESKDMFNLFLDHQLFKTQEVQIVEKTDDDPFYNIGDWRREVYNDEYKYIIWGESDTLVPTDYFRIIDSISIEEPHILSLSSRKMWDDSWQGVEHELLRNMRGDQDKIGIFGCGNQINLNQVNMFNSLIPDIRIVRLRIPKIDGSMLALSKDLPRPFISENLHFGGEDTCAAGFFQLKGIPQYSISTRIKGHNYNHPKKRTNTEQNRDNSEYIEMNKQSRDEMMNFLLKLVKEKNEKNKSDNSKS